MSNIFFCSDHHFSHVNILNFTRSDGITPLRVFKDINHMNEFMVMQHNRVVSVNDRVYFLGDVTFHKRELPILSRMNGRKVLIKGNHDTLDLKDYVEYFDDIRAVHQFKGFIMSHIPIHPDSLGRWGHNIHGHLHNDMVKTRYDTVDHRYFNVSVERINFTPISLEDLKKALT